MNRSLSTYLDLSRFVAAFSVVLAHMTENWSPGIFPFFTHLGLEAVGLFFALSGFVIGYVTDTKEATWDIYVINRMARLYSVVVPCLLISFILDNIGRYVEPDYAAKNWPELSGIVKEALKSIYSLTFLNSIWSSKVIPGSDAPFWTLGYEVAYYAIFGVALFANRLSKYILPVALCVFVGPKITCMFPLWLIGFSAYRFCRVRDRSRAFGRPLFFGVMTLWLVADYLRWHGQIGMSTPQDDQFWTETVWQLYWGGLFFVGTIIGFNYSAFVLPAPLEKVIRWLAGATFTLYLLHWPILRLLDSILPGRMPINIRWCLMMSGAVGSAILVASFTEHKKDDWRRAIDGIRSRVMSGLQSYRANQF